jgi:hypothetical protein
LQVVLLKFVLFVQLDAKKQNAEAQGRKDGGENKIKMHGLIVFSSSGAIQN